MKRIISAAIALTAATSILISTLPAHAAAVSSDLYYSFSMIALTAGKYDSSPVVFNVNYNNADSAVSKNYHYRQYINNVWNAWADVNYDVIGTSADRTVFAMEFTDETKVPGLCKDISSIKDTGSAAFSTAVDDGVDINNLYYVLESRNSNAIVYAGVPASSYLSTSVRSNNITVPLTDFIKNENYLGTSDGSGSSFDLSKFCGMGVMRIKDKTGTASSSGKVYLSKLALTLLPPVDDLAATDINTAKLSFTAPTLTTIDKYTINATDEKGKERNIILTSADLVADGSKYIWTDTAAGADKTYTYKIKLHDSEYDIESAWSNSVTVQTMSNDSGDPIPTDNESTVKVEYSNRNFTWPFPDGILWYNGTIGMPKDGASNGYIDAAAAGMGAGKVFGYYVNYDLVYKSEEDAAKNQDYMYDWVWNGYNLSEDCARGGTSGKDKKSINIDAYKSSGYVVYYINISDTVDLYNLYFSIGATWINGNWYDGNFLGVPVLDYITEADKGKAMYVVVPLADFTLSNPHVYQSEYTWSWTSAVSGVADMDFTHFERIGFMRVCKGVEQHDSSGYIYCADMLITNVNPVTDLKVADIKQGKVLLSWTHSTSAVTKYNIYRTDEGGTKTLIGTSDTNKFADKNGGKAFETGKTYTYDVEAIDEYGSKSLSAETDAVIEPIDHPRNFSAEAYHSDGTEIKADISWESASYGDVKDYVLYKNGSAYKTFLPDETTFTDTDITEHEIYTYYMISESTEGNVSIKTDMISVTAACLNAPESLKCSQSGDNSEIISWDDVKYALSYNVYVNGVLSGSTEKTSYTLENLPYNKQFVFSVIAVNKSGAKSNSVSGNMIYLNDPSLSTAATVFDDSVKSGFTIGNDGLMTVSQTNEKSIQGTKSIKCDATTADYADQALVFDCTWNMQAYRTSASKLCFWMYADENTDLSCFKVAVGTKTTLSWMAVPLLSELPVENYANVQGEWVYVEIPVSDFSDTGSATKNGITVSSAIDFSAIKELEFIYNNSKQEKGPVIYLDDITIKQTSSWTVSSVKDENGISLPGTISANNKKFIITFSKDMDPLTLTDSYVTIKKSDETVISSYGTYASGVFTLNLLSALEKNSTYTVNINGSKSTDGASSKYSASFVTNTDNVTDATYTLPTIEPIITCSKSSSLLNVKVSLPDTPVYNVDTYRYVIGYDPSCIKPNGTDAVKLCDSFSAAAIDKNSGEITISGNYGKNILSGDLVSIVFSVLSSGTAKITVNGTENACFTSTGNISEIPVKGEKSVSVTVSSGEGGGGGGGSSSGGSASRSSGTAGVAAQPNAAPVPSTAGTATLSDTGDVLWAKDSIEYLLSNGYISGYPDGTFRPENTVTREEFCTMLVKVFGFSTEDVTCDFTDVEEDAWCKKYIAAATAKGVISGIDKTTFGVGQNITREDMCTMIFRAVNAAHTSPEKKYDALSFNDTDEISKYAYDAVNSLYCWGLIKGVGNDLFSPQSEVNRAMAAKVLYETEQIIH